LWVLFKLKNIFRDCISTEDEYLVDLTEAINKQGVYAINESTQGSCKKIFKSRDEMLDRSEYCESNLGDPELLIYIPFNSACKIKSMTMIGGEDGSSPSNIKLYVNKENPDFDLIEGAQCSQVKYNF
jgi:hypothetical protein